MVNRKRVCELLSGSRTSRLILAVLATIAVGLLHEKPLCAEDDDRPNIFDFPDDSPDDGLSESAKKQIAEYEKSIESIQDAYNKAIHKLQGNHQPKLDRAYSKHVDEIMKLDGVVAYERLLGANNPKIATVGSGCPVMEADIPTANEKALSSINKYRDQANQLYEIYQRQKERLAIPFQRRLSKATEQLKLKLSKLNENAASDYAATLEKPSIVEYANQVVEPPNVLDIEGKDKPLSPKDEGDQIGPFYYLNQLVYDSIPLDIFNPHKPITDQNVTDAAQWLQKKQHVILSGKRFHIRGQLEGYNINANTGELNFRINFPTFIRTVTLDGNADFYTSDKRLIEQIKELQPGRVIDIVGNTEDALINKAGNRRIGIVVRMASNSRITIHDIQSMSPPRHEQVMAADFSDPMQYLSSIPIDFQPEGNELLEIKLDLIRHWAAADGKYFSEGRSFDITLPISEWSEMRIIDGQIGQHFRVKGQTEWKGVPIEVECSFLAKGEDAIKELEAAGKGSLVRVKGICKNLWMRIYKGKMYLSFANHTDETYEIIK